MRKIFKLWHGRDWLNAKVNNTGGDESSEIICKDKTVIEWLKDKAIHKKALLLKKKYSHNVYQPFPCGSGDLYSLRCGLYILRPVTIPDIHS